MTSDAEIPAFDKNVPDTVFEIPEDYRVQDVSGGSAEQAAIQVK